MRERRGQRMNKVWYGSGSAPLWLRVAARLFGALAVLRGGMYRRGLLHSRKLAVPVVVVGNLTVGGTGKTPLTAALAMLLLRLGRRPGIATRGHGRRSKSLRMVRPDSTWEQVGDEPLLLHRRTGVPVCVATRREFDPTGVVVVTTKPKLPRRTIRLSCGHAPPVTRVLLEALEAHGAGQCSMCNRRVIRAD